MAVEYSKLQKTLGIMAAIDVIITLAVSIISVIGIGETLRPSFSSEDNGPATETKVFAIAAPIVSQIQLISVCLLCVGIKNRKLCKIWILITINLTTLQIIILSMLAATSITFFIFVRVIRILFSICEIVAVFYLMKELKEAENLSGFSGQGDIVAAPIVPNVIQQQEPSAPSGVAVSGVDNPPPYNLVNSYQ